MNEEKKSAIPTLFKLNQQQITNF